MNYMKLYLTVLGVILSLAVSAQTPVSTTALKVGFTSLGDIMEKMPEAKNASNVIAFMQMQAENEVKRLQKEFQEKYEVFEKGAAQMSEVIRKDKQTELQNLDTRIQEFSRNAEANIQRKYNELMKPISTKAFEVIGAVAKENGYQYIINTDPGANALSNLLFTTNEFDVTNLVIAKLGISAKSDSVAVKPTKPTGSPKPVQTNKAVPAKK